MCVLRAYGGWEDDWAVRRDSYAGGLRQRAGPGRMTAWNAGAEDVFGKAAEAEKDDKLDSGLGRFSA